MLQGSYNGVAKEMFTWNFQHISKSRLVDTFGQLKLDQAGGDVLCRIHTATHRPEEAVDLARYIKELVPDVKIFGTSTSAIISNGKLIPDQCIISITQMNNGHINTARFSTFNEETNEFISPDALCQKVKGEVLRDETKFLLTFFTATYYDIYSFVEKSNTCFPGVKMLGGLADSPGSGLNDLSGGSFVFDENGWNENGVILAAFDGNDMEVDCTYATGVEPLGRELEVTDTFGRVILSFDGKDAAQTYSSGIGVEPNEKNELTILFPFVYSDAPEFPAGQAFFYEY